MTTPQLTNQHVDQGAVEENVDKITSAVSLLSQYPELRELVESWPELSIDVREKLLNMVKAKQG